MYYSTFGSEARVLLYSCAKIFIHYETHRQALNHDYSKQYIRLITPPHTQYCLWPRKKVAELFSAFEVISCHVIVHPIPSLST